MIKQLILLIFLAGFVHASGYFQQYVNYNIYARLVESQNLIDASENLVYVNNAPDTLNQIYFYLYFNKYRQGAYTEYGDTLARTMAWIHIDSVSVNGVSTSDYDIYRTIMQINLKDPLVPGDTVHFSFAFRSKLPFASDRYGYQGSHYDVGNWFPTPVVYDKEGWHLHQHIDNEFYQEWGDFRVNITVPKGYVVGATGSLLNAETAMKDTTREVREWYLHNVDDTVSSTTWQYEAKNVHDFAWTADPEYRYITEHWDGIAVHYLVMRYNYLYWKAEIKAATGTVRFLSEQFGRYPYDQITVADTYIKAGGMEYPGIVFINTMIDPVYDKTFFRGVIVHEIAHNWFYGLLGSNQTEFEWMDEGFTTFAEILAIEDIYGKKNNYFQSGYDWFTNTFSFERDERTWNRYSSLRLVTSGREQDPVNTMPDRFRYGVYTSQYDKTASILFMLENTMGKDIFWQGMHNYFDQWNQKHPQPEDFKHVMEHAAGADMDWFFNQWLYSTRTLDYCLKDFDNIKSGKGLQVTFEVDNLSDIHMPVDILFKLKNGDSLLYHIPVDYFYPKIRTRKYLPVWHFSQKHYQATIKVPAAVEEVVIDPFEALLDINRLNNSSNFLPDIAFYFLKNQRYAPPTDAYLWETWPGIFYNDIDKFKIGLANYAGYLNRKHLLILKTWYKTATADVDFFLNYRNPVLEFNQSWLFATLYRLDGRQGARGSMSFQYSSNLDFKLSISHYKMFDDSYLSYPWDRGVYNTVGLTTEYKTSAEQHETALKLTLENALAGSADDFSLARLDLRQSFYSQYNDYVLEMNLSGGVADASTPLQEKFNLAGANGIAEFNDPFYRAKGTLPVSWRRKGHLYKYDFAAVRGISLVSDEYIDNNIWAGSLDFKFPNIFSFTNLYLLDFFDNALFFDAGAVWSGKMPDLKDTAKSAGVTVALNNFGTLNYLFGLREIKVDFPLWIEQPGSSKNDEFKWLVSFDFQLDRNLLF